MGSLCNKSNKIDLMMNKDLKHTCFYVQIPNILKPRRSKRGSTSTEYAYELFDNGENAPTKLMAPLVRLLSIDYSNNEVGKIDLPTL